MANNNKLKDSKDGTLSPVKNVTKVLTDLGGGRAMLELSCGHKITGAKRAKQAACWRCRLDKIHGVA